MNACFMFGNHDTCEAAYPLIENEVERHITEYGVREFIVGRYGGFDRMAARAVRSAKTLHPKARLTLLTPYLDNRPLPEGFDGAVYPDGLEAVPKRYAISRANRAMIDACDYLIAFVAYGFGNAYQFLEYAKKRNKQIVNIGMQPY